MNNKIIIIDNDTGNLEIMAYILREKGYEVITSSDSIPLMNILQQNPALLILDHWLDGEFGDEISLKLKSFLATAHIPIMLISTNNEVEEISIICKADAFISKPFDITELEAKVKKLVEPVS